MSPCGKVVAIAGKINHGWTAVSSGNNSKRTVGGKLCANLIQEIEAKSIAITTERVWNEPLPTIRVDYRNLNKVWFRAYVGLGSGEGSHQFFGVTNPSAQQPHL